MSGGTRFSGRLAIQQRILPIYRASLFEALAAACEGGLSVFAGQAQPEEAVVAAQDLHTAHFNPGRNRYLTKVSSPLCLVWQAGLLRWLEAWNPDALIVEANPRIVSTYPGVRWMHNRGRPVLGWGLGSPQAVRGLKGKQQVFWQSFLHKFDALIAYSHQGAAEYQALGFPGERIFVAPNAVAPHPKKPPPTRPEILKDRPRVLFVGRLQTRKRIDILLRACAGLPERLKPHLLIVGEGPAQDELQALAKRVYPQAKFFGMRRGVELQELYTVADLFVLPGTGGLAIQEAMAYGLPVIVAAGDGTQSDLVRMAGGNRPENGWVVQPDDLEALQIVLSEALSDVSRLRRLGAESFRIVAEEINLENIVRVFMRALQFTMAGESISMRTKHGRDSSKGEDKRGVTD